MHAYTEVNNLNQLKQNSTKAQMVWAFNIFFKADV